MRTLSTTIDVTTPSLCSSSSSSSVLAEAPEHSPLHSPVPYLFGGLAAMLCLIAFALLILAFSYWKISGFLGGGNHSDRTGEMTKTSEDDDQSIKVYEEKFVVIMAGDEIPTFLATPICIKGSTFEGGDLYSINDQDKKDDDDDEIETPKGEEETHPPTPTTTTIAPATGTTESTDEMVHHQTENRETHEENPDQHQTH